MRVIIIGASKVGHALTKCLCEEGYDIVVIDKSSEKIDEITDSYDCNGFVGNGSSKQLLQKAGIDGTSLLIAVTKQDEVNILCCNMAKQLGVKRTIAAVRGPEYSQDTDFLSESMGVDMLLNPDGTAAKAINKMIRYAISLEIEQFKDLQVSVATVLLEKNSILDNVPMPEVQKVLGYQTLICSIERQGKIFTPNGQYHLEAGDLITIAATNTDMTAVLGKLNIEEKKVKKTVIVGGSKIGYYLVKRQLDQGNEVTIVDNDINRCQELLEEFPQAQIINGSGTDAALMEKVLKNADACAAVTGNDEENLIVSLYAKSVGMNRISAEILNLNYINMLKKSGIDHVFSRQDVVLSRIIREARLLEIGMRQDDKRAMKWLHTLNEGKNEASEFEVDESFPLLGIPLKDSRFKTKKGILLAAIARNGESMVANGDTCLQVGDTAVVVTAEHKITQLADIIDKEKR